MIDLLVNRLRVAKSWRMDQQIPLLCGCLSFAISMALVLPRLFDLSKVSGWFPAYYYVNYYRFGFVKRALLGTLLTPLNMVSGMDVRLFALLVFSFGLLTFSFLFWLLFSIANDSLTRLSPGIRWRFALVFVLSPALFLRLGYDAGRIDVFWLSCGLSALLVAMHARILFAWRWIAVLAFSIAALLIYEGSVFVLIPFLAVVLARGAPRKGFFFGLSYAGLMGLLTLAVERFGAFEEGSQILGERLASMASALGDPLSIVLTGSLVRENINLSLGNRYNWFGNNPLLFSYFLLWVLLLLFFVRASSHPGFALILLISPFFGLALNVIALDYIRYLSLVLAVSAMSILALVIFDSAAICGLRSRIPLLSLLSVGFLLGPLGTVPDDSLPLSPLQFLLGAGG